MDNPTCKNKSRMFITICFFVSIAAITVAVIFHVLLSRLSSVPSKCPSHIRQIVLALKMYTVDDASHQYPPNLSVLAQVKGLEASTFICDGSNDTPAKTLDNNPKSWTNNLSVAKHTCSYIYIPPRDLSENPSAIMIYEPLDNHDEGINIGYADGHSDWIANPVAEKAIKEIQYGQNPPPAIK